MPIEARRIAADHPDALALTAAMVDEVSEQYGGRISGPGLPSASPEDFSPPGGAYVALYEDGRPLAGGGIKRLSDGVGEIKRMYVVPEARGRGLARALLEALEDAARDLGHRVARLDTGARQPHAERLYRGAGYRAIADYNANPFASFWGEKTL
jgi:GNAT superfamily N-acetyltransferase